MNAKGIDRRDISRPHTSGCSNIPIDRAYARDIIAQFVFPGQDKPFYLWPHLQVLRDGLKHVKK